jgi:hypothetical protein
MTSLTEPTRQRRVWGVWRIAALVLACVALAAGFSLVSIRASAAFLPVTGAQGPHLQLQSDPFPAQFLDMSPGTVDHWQIAASLVDPNASLNVQFDHSGALVNQPVDGLQVQVQRCDAVWANVSTTPTCSDSPANVFGPAAASAMPIGSIIDLAGITNAKGKFLLVTLSIPNTPQARADKSLQGLTGNLGFGLTAADNTAIVTPPPTPSGLAFTGADALPLFLLAIGAIALGIIVSGARKIRSLNARKATS